MSRLDRMPTTGSTIASSLLMVSEAVRDALFVVLMSRNSLVFTRALLQRKMSFSTCLVPRQAYLFAGH